MSGVALTIAGGGLAGCAAAMEAAGLGANVTLWEQSALPRHKVCGEFLSPEAAAVLDHLGVFGRIESRQPARIRRYRLVLGQREKSSRLAEPAFGLSRFALDHLLWTAAIERGATPRQERITPPWPAPTVLALGRQFAGVKNAGEERQFGFKAHFSGPANDAVELYFFDGWYLGINAIEGGLTNICGLAPERLLRNAAFDIDHLLHGYAPLRERLGPLRREFPEWKITGPLFYRNRFDEREGLEGIYPAGDMLSFVDPFTGSGMLCALISGTLAGRAAATGVSTAEYVRQCREKLARPYRVSTRLRQLAMQPWAPRLMPLVPGDWLFRWTRPRWV